MSCYGGRSYKHACSQSLIPAKVKVEVWRAGVVLVLRLRCPSIHWHRPVLPLEEALLGVSLAVGEAPPGYLATQSK